MCVVGGRCASGWQHVRGAAPATRDWVWCLQPCLQPPEQQQPAWDSPGSIPTSRRGGPCPQLTEQAGSASRQQQSAAAGQESGARAAAG